MGIRVEDDIRTMKIRTRAAVVDLLINCFTGHPPR